MNSKEIVDIPAGQLHLDRIVRSDIENKTFERDIGQLSRSIASRGVMTPLIVCPDGRESYAIIDGNRRYEAGLAAGLESFPCVVRRDIRREEEDTVTMVGFSTNEMRSDLLPSQEVEALLRVMETGGISLDEIADATGKTKAQLKHILSRKNLDSSIKKMVDRGEIAPSASRSLAPLKKKEQKEVVETLKALDLPVSADTISLYQGRKDIKSDTVSRRVRKKLVENIGLQASETASLQKEYRSLEKAIGKALPTVRLIMATPALRTYLGEHHPDIAADFEEVLEVLGEE